MKKLMAFDLDGTLLFDRTIDPANVQAIHRWQQAGNLAVCATGKSIFATKLALDNPPRANSAGVGGARLLRPVQG